MKEEGFVKCRREAAPECYEVGVPWSPGPNGEEYWLLRRSAVLAHDGIVLSREQERENEALTHWHRYEILPTERAYTFSGGKWDESGPDFQKVTWVPDKNKKWGGEIHILPTAKIVSIFGDTTKTWRVNLSAEVVDSNLDSIKQKIRENLTYNNGTEITGNFLLEYKDGRPITKFNDIISAQQKVHNGRVIRVLSRWEPGGRVWCCGWPDFGSEIKVVRRFTNPPIGHLGNASPTATMELKRQMERMLSMYRSQLEKDMADSGDSGWDVRIKDGKFEAFKDIGEGQEEIVPLAV